MTAFSKTLAGFWTCVVSSVFVVFFYFSSCFLRVSFFWHVLLSGCSCFAFDYRIPEYPYGLLVLVVLMVLGCAVIKRKTSQLS